MFLEMTPKPNPVAAHRERQRARGLQRLDLQIAREDAPLLRAVAASLANPERAVAARLLLRHHFTPAPPRSLKDLLSQAPFDDLDLERPRDMGRPLDL